MFKMISNQSRRIKVFLVSSRAAKVAVCACCSTTWFRLRLGFRFKFRLRLKFRFRSRFRLFNKADKVLVYL